MKLFRMKVLAISIILISSEAHAGLAEDVAAQEAKVERLREKLQPLTNPLQIRDADLRVFLSLSPLISAVSELNTLPGSQRTIQVQSTGSNGKFWEDGDWCHSYVELDRADSLHATAVLDNLNASIRDDGTIVMSTHTDIHGKVQVKFQFKGKRVSGPFGIGNVCPPGGGVGSSIGVGFNKSEDIALALTFARAPDGRSLAYTAKIEKPSEVKVTAEIGLGPIGTYGHPMSIAIPQTPITSGTVPLLIASGGSFKLPGNGGQRNYSFALSPVSFTTNKDGITASWKATVAFTPVTQ